MAAPLIIKSKRSSRRLRARCVSPCPATSASARSCPAPKGAMKITILDYGAGNVPPSSAPPRLGAESQRTASAECIAKRKPCSCLRRHYAALVVLSMRKSFVRLWSRHPSGVPFLGSVWFASIVQIERRGIATPGLISARNRLRAAVKRETRTWVGTSLKRSASLPCSQALTLSIFYFAHSFAALDSNALAAATCSHGADSPPSSSSKISCVQFIRKERRLRSSHSAEFPEARA